MAAWRDKFRIKLPFQDKEKFIAIERWANSLPIPFAGTAALASNSANLTTSYANIMSVVYPTGMPSSPVMVMINLGVIDGGTGWGRVEYRIVEDGAASAEIGWTTSSGSRIFSYAPTKAGSHTLVLQARKSINAGTVSIAADQTSMTVLTLVS